MIFSKRLKLATAYEEWCTRNPEIQKDAAVNVITFLDTLGVLKGNPENTCPRCEEDKEPYICKSCYEQLLEHIEGYKGIIV
jgi:hypothetical protein